MFKILILSNIFIICFAHEFFTKSIIQLEVGNYIITPSNYSYNPQLIIEMWGGGGAGNLCNGYGGNSGGYLKFILNTHFQDINITVGNGGNGNINHNSIDGALCDQPASYKKYNVHYPDSGSDSILNIGNITIIASGGKWNNSQPINSVNKIPKNINIIQNINSQSGKLFGMNILPLLYCGETYCCSWTSPGITVTTFSGGYSYGGSGGNPSSAASGGAYSSSCISLASSGETPSGGGGGVGLLPDYVKPDGESNGGPSPCFNFRCANGVTNGGHGRVIIYLNKII
jgi:hypothetical protein